MTGRIMIHVQHLLGTGHLKRMSVLSDALMASGWQVLLVTGGMPAPHVMPHRAAQILQLPPLQAQDASFSGLADRDGAPASDALKAERTQMLLQAFDTFEPDILLVELFPLGRRQLRFELLPLLERAREAGRRTACSVRDIVNRRPRRESEALDWLNRFFDLVLVHGEADLTPLSDSVPGIGSFAGKVAHTGYLGDPPPGPRTRRPEVLVSAGGGASGRPIYEAAAAASRQIDRDVTWRFRVPLEMAERGDLASQARPDAVIEPVGPDFRALLAAASLSISQFGYNTAMDLMLTETPAIICPFEGDGETEQSRRAEALAGPGLNVVPESGLSGTALAEAIDAILTNPVPFRRSIARDGGTRAVTALARLLEP